MDPSRRNPARMDLRRLERGAVLVGALLVALACGRTLGYSDWDDEPAGDGGQVHDATPGDAQVARDAGPDSGDAQLADAHLSADAGIELCGCPEDEPAYQWGECIPPLVAGCPAVECVPGQSSCGQGYTCLDCGAAACCHCAACRPACVFTGPAQGPLPEYLKIRPTTGPARQEQTLTVEGFPFYVGALFYLVRVGESGELFQAGGTTCSFEVSVPGQDVGRVPVWVSQYGGTEPWVLAGFFTFSSGDYETCVQPGFPCAPTQACCATGDVPVACVSGRCLLQ